MTQRPITWTEYDVATAMSNAGRMSPCPTGSEWLDILRNLGAVHPHEAREREREAFDAGVYWHQHHNALFLTNPPKTAPSKDELYPSLLPKSPPPLVLSTGTWTYSGTISGMPWQGAGFGACFRSPNICTASDARKLADWLAEYGSEEERK